MELSPEIKAQLAEQKKQCIHCKLLSGEIPNAHIVFQDDKTAALLDIYPAVKGHAVYLLKEHYPMPVYIPGEEFRRKCALIPGLSKAIKSGMVKTGITIFMAIGSAAGQQSYHFLAHFLPREENDGFFNFLFSKKVGALVEADAQLLTQTIFTQMNNYFVKNPASWHTEKGNIPSYLTEIYETSTVIYEDEKILCIAPPKGMAKGHLIIYSKTEEKYIERLSQEDSVHLFSAASLASTAVFEHFKAQGTNVILKSGECDDNPRGKLEVHIFPRWQNDPLQELVWSPKQPNYDLGSIAKKIKEETWKVEYVADKQTKPTEEKKVNTKTEVLKPTPTPQTAAEEINKAINSFKIS
ncbi:MAG: HIT domain-containing protein [Nanoarchaeota archaeon]